jgi:hypothetical protein
MEIIPAASTIGLSEIPKRFVSRSKLNGAMIGATWSITPNSAKLSVSKTSAISAT